MNKQYAVLLFCCLMSCTFNKDGIRNFSYKGVVLKIYNDTNNRYAYTFQIKTDDNKIIKEVGHVYPYSWKYASVGDSIIKEKGELYIRIKKKNGDSKVFYFDP